MVPKSKRSNVEENQFLPPPINLDRIPLANKDYLISETRFNFDFVELQSWFKDTFIDQSDEIWLWKSIFSLYLFPQVQLFPEFALKFQVCYLLNQRAMLASEVTPGLQQEQSLTPISLCHDLFIKGDRKREDSE
jgi:hypothetical protein